MDSFIFNDFKHRLMTGNADDVEVLKFFLVNKNFGEDLAEILPSLGSRTQLERYIFATDPTVATKGKALSKYVTECTPVRYTYKVSNTTLTSERPSYVDLDNWDEFDAKYPGQINLYLLFLDKNGQFHREYDTDELDATGNVIKKTRGFYYVETMEELKWCAEKVNGTINGSRSEIYNNFINIVLGDNLGYGKAEEGSYKHIDFSIGSSIDRPFEGIFYGNGYIIQNIALECKNNSNGIIGYLGNSGIISTIRIEGHNLIKCEKALNINHMVTDACDVNAGFLCGKNNGTIIDVTFRGSVTFADFIPAVYPVSNKSDDTTGNAFDNPDANRFYPDYLCINAMSNIVPYLGYFGEGVFGTWAASGNGIDKGYWKSNFLYFGQVTSNAGGQKSNYYPYDNGSCCEWAYPSGVSGDSIYDVTGHTLFYNVNAMFDTNSLLSDTQGDWASYLSMLKVTDTNSTKYPGGKDYNWELGATQYLDKSIKMHQFNRVSYNTGLLIGCNEGSVSNIAMHASAYTSGTYVGFMGGIAGKQATEGTDKIFNNICVNLTAKDVSDYRQRYVSDDGDMISSEGNKTNQFVIATDNICYDSSNGTSLLKQPFFGVNRIQSKQKYYDKLNIGGFNSDGTYYWGDTSVIRFNLNGYSGLNSGTLRHVFTIPDTTMQNLVNIYKCTSGSYFNLNPSIFDIDIYTKFMPADQIYANLLNSPSMSATVTGANNAISAFSGFKFGNGDELALMNFEQRGFPVGNEPVGLVHPNCPGIVYNFGRFGHEGSFNNDFKDVLSISNTAVGGDVYSTLLELGDVGYIGLVSGYDYTSDAQFAVYNMNPSANWYGAGGHAVYGGGIELGAYVSMSGTVSSSDTPGTVLVSNMKVVSCHVGQFVLKYNGELEVPSNKERTLYNVFGIYGTNNYKYNKFNIVGAKNVEFTIVREIYLPYDPTTMSVPRKYEFYTFTIPEIMNNKNIGGTKFTNKAADEFFIANYEGDSTKPVISYLTEHYSFDGCKNYNIDLKSIKNIGALFGSLVLGTEQNMSNISAYLCNQHVCSFEHYANQDAFEAGQITDLGFVVDISAFDVTKSASSGCFFNVNNLSAFTNRQGFFRTSGTGSVRVKSLTYNGTTYGYDTDVDGFELTGGELVGLTNNKLMYAYDSFAFPKQRDYSFDNRFAPFAAVCEYNSCNISDKYQITQPNTLAALHPYINFTNINCVYDEPNYDNNEYFTRKYGPMFLACRNPDIFNDRGKIGPSYAFGIALPFIAEIKPTYLAIPSIQECPLSNIDKYGVTDTSAVYKRVGMFTMDQNFAAPTNDPNFWSVNLTVDLPGFAGVIDRNEIPSEQVTEYRGFKLENNDNSTELGKTVGNLLDHLFDMSKVRINNANYGYMDETNGINYSNAPGYGRYTNQIKYAEVCSNCKLGFDPQYKNDNIIGGGYFTQNKVIGVNMYFGSNLTLQHTHYTSAYKNPDEMNIVRNVYNTDSIGEYYAFYSPVTTTAAPTKELATSPFSIWNVHNALQDLSNKSKVDPYFRALKGNCRKADRADSYNGVDKFKYNYTKKVEEGNKFSVFTHRVVLDERGGKYGYWFEDPLNIVGYDKVHSKFYNGENDEVRYDGSTLHVGAMFSEKCILENLRVDSYISAASGIMCEDFDGLYVIDSAGRNVMYINAGMGKCDGSQAWSLQCNVSGAHGGLLMEIE